MSFESASRERTRKTFLPRRASLVLDGAEGTIINVESGCLWVTLERDPRDVVLAGGMRFRVDRPGRTIVVAEEDSRVRLTRRATVMERIAARFSRSMANAIRRGSDRVSRLSAPYF